MRANRSLRLLQAALRPQSTRARVPTSQFLTLSQSSRHFQTSAAFQKLQTHKLSDIGEGVKEVQIIQWFVEEGAAVEEWAPLCEVQSDKASVEITSRYTGVVKKIHFDRDAIVQVGDAMLEIEVEGEGEEDGAEEEQTEQHEEVAAEEDNSGQKEEPESKSTSKPSDEEDTSAKQEEKIEPEPEPEPEIEPKQEVKSQPSTTPQRETKSSQKGHLATPAVRGLLKEHGLELTDIEGTGKDGRVLKEDVYRHLEGGQKTAPSTPSATPAAPATPKPELDAKQTETTQNLTPVQSAMFKTMSKSLSIPHFLFSDRIDVTSLASMRSRLNAARDPGSTPKLSYLPFIIKAVSLSLNKYPQLNARLDLSDNNKPKLMLRSNHNIGVAMDTPAGLLVPVIRNVNARSVTSIAQELQRLSQLGQTGKLSNNDLSGGTITVSNIGNIGGETLSPVIVEGQLAILGIGKIKATPVFAADGQTVQRADLMNTSWSADHRVVDGATMARMAQVMQKYLEQPELMLVDMS